MRVANAADPGLSTLYPLWLRLWYPNSAAARTTATAPTAATVGIHSDPVEAVAVLVLLSGALAVAVNVSLAKVVDPVVEGVGKASVGWLAARAASPIAVNVRETAASGECERTWAADCSRVSTSIEVRFSWTWSDSALEVEELAVEALSSATWTAWGAILMVCTDKNVIVSLLSAELTLRVTLVSAVTFTLTLALELVFTADGNAMVSFSNWALALRDCDCTVTFAISSTKSLNPSSSDAIDDKSSNSTSSSVVKLLKSNSGGAVVSLSLCCCSSVTFSSASASLKTSSAIAVAYSKIEKLPSENAITVTFVSLLLEGIGVFHEAEAVAFKSIAFVARVLFAALVSEVDTFMVLRTLIVVAFTGTSTSPELASAASGAAVMVRLASANEITAFIVRSAASVSRLSVVCVSEAIGSS